jgi:hypothetical protein
MKKRQAEHYLDLQPSETAIVHSTWASSTRS